MRFIYINNMISIKKILKIMRRTHSMAAIGFFFFFSFDNIQQKLARLSQEVNKTVTSCPFIT